MNSFVKFLLGIFAINVLKDVFSSSNDAAISGIKQENIKDNYLIKHDRNTNVGDLKRSITQSINSLIVNCNTFKIGETGSPNDRRKAYSQYSEMFLLCVSKSESFIDELENYYNEKYIDHPKNENLKTGSAGKMGNTGNYFLYIVVA